MLTCRELMPKLPNSESSFASLRSQNNIYVDKTEYVYLLAARLYSPRTRLKLEVREETLCRILMI